MLCLSSIVPSLHSQLFFTCCKKNGREPGPRDEFDPVFYNMQKKSWESRLGTRLVFLYPLQDVVNDIQGAQAVGMKGILVKTGVWCLRATAVSSLVPRPPLFLAMRRKRLRIRMKWGHGNKLKSVPSLALVLSATPYQWTEQLSVVSLSF